MQCPMFEVAGSPYPCELQQAEIERLRNGLEQSVNLQSHYAKLLNMYDGGERICFRDANEWLKRLNDLVPARAAALKGGGE